MVLREIRIGVEIFGVECFFLNVGGSCMVWLKKLIYFCLELNVVILNIKFLLVYMIYFIGSFLESSGWVFFW